MRSIISISLLSHASITAAYLAPYPPGKHNVTLRTGTLIDYNRNDPFAATPTLRTLMLSVFQPAICASVETVQYMPDQTAQYQGLFLQSLFNLTVDLSPLFLGAELPVCPSDSRLAKCKAPILLFSPGYSIPRLYYNILASAIASKGFTVITIDHPEDANIITYPDGTVVYNTDPNQDIPTFQKFLPIRVADISFVIDQLSNNTAMVDLLPHCGAQSTRTDRVAVLGHSLGGVAAVLAASQDPRISGAINWDGTFIDFPSPNVSQPVLLVSHDTDDDTWIETWPLLQGPKLWINVANATHESFADVGLLLQAAGEDGSEFAEVLGTIPPSEMARILVTYSSKWMQKVFEGRIGDALLQGKKAGEFPEVSIVDKGNF